MENVGDVHQFTAECRAPSYQSDRPRSYDKVEMEGRPGLFRRVCRYGEPPLVDRFSYRAWMQLENLLNALDPLSGGLKVQAPCFELRVHPVNTGLADCVTTLFVDFQSVLETSSLLGLERRVVDADKVQVRSKGHFRVCPAQQIAFFAIKSSRLPQVYGRQVKLAQAPLHEGRNRNTDRHVGSYVRIGIQRRQQDPQHKMR